VRLSLDVSAVPEHPGGAGRYTLALTGELARRDDVDLVLVARRGDAARWQALAPGATVRDLVPGPRPVRLAWEQAFLHRALRSMGVQVHHGPHYTMPARSPVPTVVSVHDCTFFDHPEWHQRTKAPFFRRAIRTAARRAGAIVCGSETTAGRLREVCAVTARIFVAPYGVDRARFTEHEASPGGDEAMLAAAGLEPDRPYVAFLGTIEPRKGVAGLVAAFDAVAGGHPDAVLVLAGQQGWGTDDVTRAVQGARHAARIRRTGYLAEPALPALLRRAAVVAYPSLEEGGGLPALEALACGAPLVTTAGTAMEEMAGGAAVLVEPGDVGALAAALDGALSAGADDPGRAARRRLGLEVAARRTWEASAAVHLEAYRHALGGGHR
jgi:glycosyltransferase involved in cell wall biosynthesis